MPRCNSVSATSQATPDARLRRWQPQIGDPYLTEGVSPFAGTPPSASGVGGARKGVGMQVPPPTPLFPQVSGCMSETRGPSFLTPF